MVSGRGKPVKEEAMQYMALAAEEVRTVLRENAVFLGIEQKHLEAPQHPIPPIWLLGVAT